MTSLEYLAEGTVFIFGQSAPSMVATARKSGQEVRAWNTGEAEHLGEAQKPKLAG